MEADTACELNQSLTLNLKVCGINEKLMLKYEITKIKLHNLN